LPCTKKSILPPFKVNGISASTMTFPSLVAYVASSPRPLVVHFLQAAAPAAGTSGSSGSGSLAGSLAARDADARGKSRAVLEPLPTAGVAATRASVLERLTAAKAKSLQTVPKPAAVPSAAPVAAAPTGAAHTTTAPASAAAPPPAPVLPLAAALAAAEEAAVPGEFDDAPMGSETPEGEAGEFFV
jgi:hypothetical protein